MNIEPKIATLLYSITEGMTQSEALKKSKISFMHFHRCLKILEKNKYISIDRKKHPYLLFPTSKGNEAKEHIIKIRELYSIFESEKK